MHHTPSTSATSTSAFFSAPQSEAHTSWNADTGASAHMTFNRHWICNLKPYQVQIRLADGSVVYSEGVGSVHFNPVVNGQEMPPLQFSNVLYVTLHRHFIVSIDTAGISQCNPIQSAISQNLIGQILGTE